MSDTSSLHEVLHSVLLRKGEKKEESVSTMQTDFRNDYIQMMTALTNVSTTTVLPLARKVKFSEMMRKRPCVMHTFLRD